MSKQYKVIESRIVENNGYITVAVVTIEDRYNGSHYSGKGIARKSPEDEYDGNVGKDLAEVRAIKDAVKKMKSDYYKDGEYYSKKINEVNSKIDGLDSNIENLDCRIDSLINSVRN